MPNWRRHYGMEDKRHFSRINFSAPVQLTYENAEYKGELLDISLKGALIRLKTDISMKKGDYCNLRIRLPRSDIDLTFQVVLVYFHKDKYGFKFLSEDIDTITHLRRIIELNIANQEQIIDELVYWLKEK